MWVVVEFDQNDEVCTYKYRTREQARKHARRVNNNPFLRGWQVRAFNSRTLNYA